MADSFDVIGFVRDMGLRKRAKQFLSQHQETLANGSPESIAQLVSLDPNNPHLVSGIKNVMTAREGAGSLGMQPMQRDQLGAQIEGLRAGTEQTRAQTSGIVGQEKRQQKAFENFEGGRNEFASLLSNGVSLEGSKMMVDLISQGEEIAGRQAATKATLGSDRRADVDQMNQQAQRSLENVERANAAWAGGFPGAGAGAQWLGQQKLAGQELQQRGSIADKEIAARLFPEVNQTVNATADTSQPTLRNNASAIQQQLAERLGLTIPPTAQAAPRPGPSAADVLRDATSRVRGKQPMQPAAQPASQPKKPATTSPTATGFGPPNFGELLTPEPTTALTKMVSQFVKQNPAAHNDPRLPKFGSSENLDPLEILSWVRNAQRQGQYDQQALQQIIEEFMKGRR